MTTPPSPTIIGSSPPFTVDDKLLRSREEDDDDVKTLLLFFPLRCSRSRRACNLVNGDGTTPPLLVTPAAELGEKRGEEKDN